MTADARDIDSALRELESEHAAIDELLGRLASSRSLGALSADLGELHSLLRDHFAHEERPGGLYDRMGVVSAEFRDRVRELVDGHFRILSTVRGLERDARGGESGRAHELAQAARGLHDILQQHEVYEQELVAAATRRS